MNIVLASSSPRRQELLRMLNAKNLIIHPAQSEESLPENATPAEAVVELSRQKAREVSVHFSRGDIIIAADTVVSLDGEILGKPHSEAQAEEMLADLSGREHRVYTGVTVINEGREICEFEETTVFFRDITQREIMAYVLTGEPMDKAGAYGIQGKGGLFVKGIVGDYFNVMGLPICRLGIILSKLGVDLI